VYLSLIEEGRAASKSPRKKFGYFLSMSQQAVSSSIFPNSAVRICFPKKNLTKTKAARVLISWLPHKFRSLKILGTYNCLHFATPQRLNPKKQKNPEGKNLIWFEETEKKFAKISMTTFTYRSSSYLYDAISLLISCCRDAGSAKMALLVPKGIARYPDTGDSVKVCISGFDSKCPFADSQLRRYRLWQWIYCNAS
jgi:hypothetical protein